MDFPVYIFKIHPHIFFETLGIFIAARLYFYTRKKSRMNAEQNLIVIFFMLLFSFIFSRLITILQYPENFIKIFQSLDYFFTSGKTLVGGLLGGIIGVEIGKKITKVNTRTGDDFVFPFIIAVILGRIGCFLTGLSDNTYGIETSLFLGINFGDNINRHPTQLYEVLFFIILGYFLYKLKRKSALINGTLFQIMVTSYLIFRFFIDFIKPYPRSYFFLDSIQIACLLGIFYYISLLRRSLCLSLNGESQ